MYEVLSSYLENGLKIIFHPLRNTKTVSAGIWVKQGSKYESDQTNGISHLIEHLLVNASNTNNTKYKNIMNEIEFSGVQYNATTTKEYTYYYFTGLKSKLDIMIEALACIVIGNKDINKKKLNDEKAVVRQEILTYYSSLNQIVERTNQAMWGNMDVGRIIVGNQDNIDKIDYEKVQETIQESYTPENSTIIIVGDVEYKEVADLIVEKLSCWNDVETRRYNDVVKSVPGIYINNTNGKTSALSIGFRLNDDYKKKIIPIEIISSILGNPGLDSRIIKKVRIERGLAYNINSFITRYTKRGTLAFSAITSNENVEEVIKLILEEISLVKEKFFDDDEIRKAKNILETQAFLKMNDINKHLKFLGECSISNEIYSLENEIRMIRKCSSELIKDVAEEIFVNDNIGLAAIGDFNSNNVVELISI